MQMPDSVRGRLQHPLLNGVSISSRGQVEVEAGVAWEGGVSFFPTVGVAGQAAEAEGGVGVDAVAATPGARAEGVVVWQVSADANGSPERRRESTNPGPRSAPAGHCQAFATQPDTRLPEIRWPPPFLTFWSRRSQSRGTGISFTKGCVLFDRA